MLHEIKENIHGQLKRIRIKMQEQSENINKKIETMKENQTKFLDLKNTIIEFKNMMQKS